MLSRYLKRSAFKSAAAGSVLAVAAAATPAIVTVSPQIANMACGSYAAPTTTGTELALSRNMGQHGDRVRAWARTNGQGGPQGQVTFTIDGSVFAAVGSARAAEGVLVPRMRAGETYTVTARFNPDCEGQYDYQPSSDQSQLTVFKAGTSKNAEAPNRRRGDSPVVNGTVNSETPAEPGGDVEVTITNGRASRTKTVPVNKSFDGISSYRVVFGKVWKRGEWSVSARYLGTVNFKPSATQTAFKVQPRR